MSYQDNDQVIKKSHKKNIDFLSENGYKFIKFIGFGATADVFLCLNIKDNKKYAVKIFNPNIYSDIDKLNDLIKNEVNMLNKIHENGICESAHLVCVKEYLTDGQTKHFLIYNYIENSITLEKYVMRHKERFQIVSDTETEPINIGHMLFFLDMCKKIFYSVNKLHKLGIIHMDLSQNNILVVENGSGVPFDNEYYIIDFGISRFLEDLEKNKTDASKYIGTYIPSIFMMYTEEQFLSEGFIFQYIYSDYTDIFSLFIIFTLSLSDKGFNGLQSPRGITIKSLENYKNIISIFPFLGHMVSPMGDSHSNIYTIDQLLDMIHNEENTLDKIFDKYIYPERDEKYFSSKYFSNREKVHNKKLSEIITIDQFIKMIN